MKILSHFTIVFGFVGLLFFSMLQINYLERFLLLFEQSRIEHHLGDLIFQTFELQNQRIEDENIIATVEIIKNELCNANEIPSESVKIYIFNNEEINAFAIPNRQIIVYSGLINFCENPQELSSVIAHELAHIEHNHVMKKLGKEIGISMLAMMIGGNAGVEILGNISKVITSTAYDRAYEREADKTAVYYMQNTGMDPQNFKNFMLRLSNTQSQLIESMYWVSTHPDSKERAKMIETYANTQNLKFEHEKLDSLWILIKSTDLAE